MLRTCVLTLASALSMVRDRMNGVQGFSVVVQGVKADPLELDRRIEEWMLGFRQEMQNMSDEELQKHIR